MKSRALCKGKIEVYFTIKYKKVLTREKYNHNHSMKNNSIQNYQPKNPTYFLVAWKWQLEFMNNSRLSTLKENWSIPRNQPRFLSASFGAQVRHMVACIGCDFVEEPKKVSDFYTTSSSPRGWIIFRKIPKSERDSVSRDMAYYLQVRQTWKIFAIISR